MPRYLVVANQTLGGEKLAEGIRHRIAEGVSFLLRARPACARRGRGRWGRTRRRRHRRQP